MDQEERFISRYMDEIRPIIGDRELINSLLSGEPLNFTQITTVLDNFQTDIFRFDKKNNGKSILLTVANPGAYNAINPIIQVLIGDNRCSSITVIVHGVAKSLLRRDYPLFREIETGNSILQTLLLMSPWDCAISTPTVFNGPESVVLYGGKSCFGVKRLFFLIDSWSCCISALDSPEKLDYIDGVFCNDGIARLVIEQTMPGISYQIYDFGTPVLDSLMIFEANSLRVEGRQKLGIEDSFVFLYLGDISGESNKAYDSNTRMNENTFEILIRVVSNVARKYKEDNFAILLRPHPRDPNQEELFKIGETEILPSNLRVVNATNPITINEAAYSADVITSIVSTETFLAPIRGRHGILLGFEGLGYTMLLKLYGDTLLERLSSIPGIALVRSPSSLEVYIDWLYSNFKHEAITPIVDIDSTHKILNIVLAE